MKLPYGFYRANDGDITIDQRKADTVRLIYRHYLSGMSLGRIADLLFEHGIPSPRGRERWTQSIISAMLSNKKYIGAVVTFDEYLVAQGEKERRSNMDEGTKQRKATRYSSQNVLSGLLVCDECGCNYRRITRSSGEVVWRCANRVEHGRQSCHDSPTVSEQTVKELVCRELKMAIFDEALVKDSVERITVNQNSSLEIERVEQTMAQVLDW